MLGYHREKIILNTHKSVVVFIILRNKCERHKEHMYIIYIVIYILLSDGGKCYTVTAGAALTVFGNIVSYLLLVVCHHLSLSFSFSLFLSFSVLLKNKEDIY